MIGFEDVRPDSSNEVAYSSEVEDVESSYLLTDSGQPYSEPKPHESPWPLFGLPHPSAHAVESDC